MIENQFAMNSYSYATVFGTSLQWVKYLHNVYKCLSDFFIITNVTRLIVKFSWKCDVSLHSSVVIKIIFSKMKGTTIKGLLENVFSTLSNGTTNITLSAKNENFNHIGKLIKNEYSFKEWIEVWSDVVAYSQSL